MDRKQAEAYLIEKAQRDENFRQRLIGDPARVVSSEFKLTVPPRTKLTVLEENANSLYLVLPARTAGELNQEQLATVVAGTDAVGRNFFAKLAGDDAGAGDVSNKVKQSQAD